MSRSATEGGKQAGMYKHEATKLEADLPVHADCPGRVALLREVEREGIVILENVDPGENSILSYARWLGSPELDMPERLSGPPVMHLRHDSEKADQASREAYFTAGAFPLHTDLSYVPRPPRFLLMLCVEPDPAGGGESLAADIRIAWQMLTEEDRAILGERRFSFENAPNTGRGVCHNQPVYERCGAAEIWRFRADTLVYPSFAAEAVENLTAALESVMKTVAMPRGSLMILDNHRFAHGRTGFEVPSPRHFLRAYAEPAPDFHGEPANESVF